MTENMKSDLDVKIMLAANCERYTDIIQYVKELVETSTKSLSAHNRSYLSLAYKNIVGSFRSSWRILNSIQKKDDSGDYQTVLVDYKKQIEDELVATCKEAIQLIELLEKHQEGIDYDRTVFYKKMKADYFRYIAEVTRSLNWCDPAADSYRQYEEATLVAKDHLPPHNFLRLGLALNYSVFLYEIKNDYKHATAVAQNAFEEAVKSSGGFEDTDTNKDSVLIMQLLRDNLKVGAFFNQLWADEAACAEEEDSSDI